MSDDRPEPPWTTFDQGRHRAPDRPVTARASAAVPRSPAPGTTRDPAPGTTRDPAPGTTRDPAPGTTRDGPPGTTRDGAPGTTRDGAPGTTRDGAPGTTRDGAPGTARDGAVPEQRSGGRFQRVNLPPMLAERFEVDRDLGSGGEADVLLVDDRQTGEKRVIRLYRRQDLPFDAAKLERLRSADPQHLIRLLDFGTGDGCTWEILEFAREGSLEDWMRQTRGPWHPAEVLVVFDQIRAAIAYANSLGMVHRDIKPGNILVRSRHPVDLVLADFGLTKFLTGTRQMGTTSRTVAYAPPEAVSGEASRSVDWWSFGMTLVELLVGLHPFQRPDGTWQDDAMIVRELTTHDINLDAVPDARWNLLCRGLLTRAPEHRWGAEQTALWRQGGTPAVAISAAPLPVPARRAGVATYVFAGVGYDDPLMLARALRANWGEARRLMAGRAMRAPQYLAFRDWLVRLEAHEAVRAMDGGVAERPERGLMQVILALDPQAPPECAGYGLDLAHLHDLVKDATLNPQSTARQVVGLLFAEGILTICDGAAGCDGYALMDDAWHRAVEHAEVRLRGLQLQLTPAERQTMHAQLLVAAAAGQWNAFFEAAQNALGDRSAQQQPWFRALGDELARQPNDAALHTIILLAQPRAAQQTIDQHAEAQRQALLAEQQRVQRRRQELDNLSAVLGVILAVVGCVTFLGLLTGPFAIYFGVRARRTQYTSASTWAIALGAIGILTSVCCWGSMLPGMLSSLSNPGSTP